jgi:signal peptidase I
VLYNIFILSKGSLMAYSNHNNRKSGFLSSVIEIIGLLVIVFLIRTFGFGLYQVPTGSMETTMLVGERFFADKLSYNFRAPRVGEVIAFNDPYFKYAPSGTTRLFQQYVWGPSNWTKRIIAGPGSIIKGVIEEGKPVIYVNDKKLDEQYLNRYPLICVWKEDPKQLQSKLYNKISKQLGMYTIDPSVIQKMVYQQAYEYTTWKSYNPEKSFADQEFYRIAPERVVNGANDPELRYPGTPIQPQVANQTPLEERGKRFWNGSDEFMVELAADEYWAMGDNREGSKDSRWFGPIKKEQIHGRILFRIWSVDSDESWWIVDLIKNPVDFFKRIRWSRFFQIIH